MQTASRKSYREWIRRKSGDLYRIQDPSKYKGRRWRINQNQIREILMEEYDLSGMNPLFLMTRVYYKEEQDRGKVMLHNRRVNMVLDDFFNPRKMSRYYISKNHFMERHKDRLVKKMENKRKVRNTITEEYETDWTDCEVRKGGFHAHTLISDIPQDVILNPSSKIRKAINRIWRDDYYPQMLLEDEWGMQQIKAELIKYAIKDRCDFIGNSHDSLDVRIESEYASYDGYTGWKGMVAYVTKQMHNVDKMLEIYDRENNDLILT